MMTWLEDSDFLRFYVPTTPLEKELHRRLEKMLDEWDEREEEVEGDVLRAEDYQKEAEEERDELLDQLRAAQQEIDDLNDKIAELESGMAQKVDSA